MIHAYNGSIFISGFDQSSSMNGIYGGYIKFIASTLNGTYQYITFNDDITTFSSLNNNGIKIIGYNGINIYKNISSSSSSSLLFSFEIGSMVIGTSNINIITTGSSGNIIFKTSSSILINSLPTDFIAQHSTSNITINVPIIIKRDTTSNKQFHIYSGNLLSCISPSNGIKLYGSSIYGSTINLESKDIDWSASSCQIDTNSIDNNASSQDIIWLHPNCNGKDCFMYSPFVTIESDSNTLIKNLNINSYYANNIF